MGAAPSAVQVFSPAQMAAAVEALGTGQLPYGATPYATGQQTAAAVNSITISPPSNQFIWWAGLIIAGLGATAGSVQNFTATGLGPSNTTMTIPVTIPTGATVAFGPLIFTFPLPIRGVLMGNGHVYSLPSLGAGNTQSNLFVWGYFL